MYKNIKLYKYVFSYIYWKIKYNKLFWVFLDGFMKYKSCAKIIKEMADSIK